MRAAGPLVAATIMKGIPTIANGARAAKTKPERPMRRGAAFVAVRDDGAILLRKRTESGLLGGMSEVPTTGWTARKDGVRAAVQNSSTVAAG
ncbi:hypothetical protein BFN67_10810 [Pseudaminobacter manganicus]|uniref:Uncharacterized protein n=1 Tax=Manganibacter manganicus TaxID=1873176 RepID=A0A1V8RV05_9HYPH|nr:hypothetical protein BFN67_10810 [Pseudaminobacter manganicus]